MKVQFTQPVEIEVIESFDAALDDAESTFEVFSPGDTIEFEVIGHPERLMNGELREDSSLLNVQFGNGSVAFGLSTSWFNILES